MRYGSPDGHGRYGILDTDDDGRLICHECGASVLHLATHARAHHDVLAAQYREAHGLGRSTPLLAKGPRERMSEAWHASEDKHLAALEASRDPDKARESSPVGHQGNRGTSRAEVLAGYQNRGRARRGRPLTEAERDLLGDGLDLQAWAAAARILLGRDGVTSRSLAEASDISVATVAQRMRRYPPRDL